MSFSFLESKVGPVAAIRRDRCWNHGWLALKTI